MLRADVLSSWGQGLGRGCDQTPTMALLFRCSSASSPLAEHVLCARLCAMVHPVSSHGHRAQWVLLPPFYT